MAVAASDNWVGRAFGFLWCAGGMTVWIRRKIAKHKSVEKAD